MTAAYALRLTFLENGLTSCPHYKIRVIFLVVLSEASGSPRSIFLFLISATDLKVHLPNSTFHIQNSAGSLQKNWGQR